MVWVVMGRRVRIEVVASSSVRKIDYVVVKTLLTKHAENKGGLFCYIQM